MALKKLKGFENLLAPNLLQTIWNRTKIITKPLWNLKTKLLQHTYYKKMFEIQGF